MKNLRQFSAAIMLTFVLTLSAFAGDMHAPSKDGDMGTPLAGDMHTPGITGEILTPGIAGDILIPGLTMLRSLLF